MQGWGMSEHKFMQDHHGTLGAEHSGEGTLPASDQLCRPKPCIAECGSPWTLWQTWEEHVVKHIVLFAFTPLLTRLSLWGCSAALISVPSSAPLHYPEDIVFYCLDQAGWSLKCVLKWPSPTSLCTAPPLNHCSGGHHWSLHWHFIFIHYQQ